MPAQLDSKAIDKFIEEVETRSGEDVSICYQCGKCTAGCPMSQEMDLMPNQVIRLVQLGKRDKVLGSKTIWVCAACETCTTRCPQNFDIAKTMDTLRELSLKEKKAHRSARDIIVFHKSFLNAVEGYGRAHEMTLVGIYKTRTGHFLKDSVNAVRMFLRRKLKIVPEIIKGRGEVRRIFKRSREKKQ